MGILNDTEREMDSWMPKWQCTTMMGIKITSIAVHGLFFLFLAILCNFIHLLMRPLSQPRIVSDMLVGLILSNLPFVRNALNRNILENLEYIADAVMIGHMFILGLEIDPKIFYKIPIREAKVATSGVLATMVIAFLVTPHLGILTSTTINSTKYDLCLSIMLSGTASPLLTRLITDLKISKSDIGQFVVLAGVISDFFSTILICIGFTLFDPLSNYKFRETKELVLMIPLIVVQAAVAAKVAPIFFKWVNNENPQGKTVKGPYLVVSLGFVVVVCSCSAGIGRFDKILSAFISGAFMPRDGRISKMMISKFNYLCGMFFYPFFFFWVWAEAELTQFAGKQLMTWVSLFSLFLIITAGKVVGTAASGRMLGFRWSDSVTIGLLLSVKGHFHIYMVIVGAKTNQLTLSTCIVMIVVSFLVIIYTPLVVKNIIERARKRSPTQRMALQWLTPTTQLRILLCVHGPRNAGSAINFMEITRGIVDPGMKAYVTDVVELTDKIAATLTRDEGTDAVSVTDPEVLKMREDVTSLLKGYVDEEGEGIRLGRMMALSTIYNMHHDICVLAEDLHVSLIVLPFHKEQQADGSMATTNAAFRNINRKVFRHAPCSVGLLVDRGLSSIKISKTRISLNAAVIFIGGTDDREALAYAGRVASHHGVKLTVIRFLLDTNTDSVSSRLNSLKANTAAHQEEMRLDDECFAEFYDRYVAGGHVSYMEKYVNHSGQTFAALRSIEGQYDLFIVGRGGRLNTVLTAGMNDWEECPELGPIGDILSSASGLSSVLIIQQHSLRGKLNGLHEEFTML